MLIGLIFMIFNLLITFEINLKSKSVLLSKQRKIPFIILGCILLLCGTFLMISLMLMPNVYFDFRNPLSMYYRHFALPWNYAIISILISGFLALTCAESKSIGKRLGLFIMIPVTIGGCGVLLSCLINTGPMIFDKMENNNFGSSNNYGQIKENSTMLCIVSNYNSGCG